MEAKKDIKLSVLLVGLLASGGYLQYLIHDIHAEYEELYVLNLETSIELREVRELLEESREAEGLCIAELGVTEREVGSFYDDLDAAYDQLLECEAGMSHEADCMSCWDDYPWAFEEEPPC